MWCHLSSWCQFEVSSYFEVDNSIEIGTSFEISTYFSAGTGFEFGMSLVPVLCLLQDLNSVLKILLSLLDLKLVPVLKSVHK